MHVLRNNRQRVNNVSTKPSGKVWSSGHLNDHRLDWLLQSDFNTMISIMLRCVEIFNVTVLCNNSIRNLVMCGIFLRGSHAPGEQTVTGHNKRRSKGCSGEYHVTLVETSNTVSCFWRIYWGSERSRRQKQRLPLLYTYKMT